MKKLEISSSNVVLNKSSYGVDIGDKRIDTLIRENLPQDLKDYKDYPVKIKIEIEFLGDDSLNVSTEGYEVKEEKEESEGEADGQ